MKIITSYFEPDIDGVASMYAYSEFLNSKGVDTKYYFFGRPKHEVVIVCDIFGINLNSITKEEISESDEFIIVDLNGRVQIPEIVKTEQIIEIIDHHGLSKSLPSYTYIQRLQIDKIGATATIIAERYKQAGIIPSRESAILLFYGIISNSINLKANITSERDINACNWLKSVCNDISDDIIEEIFVKKSEIKDSELRSEMECEIPNVFPEFKSVVAQLEVAHLDEFLSQKKNNILEIMQQVKIEKGIDYIFIDCIDILKGRSTIFALDDESRKFVTDTYGYIFDENNMVYIDRIIQRKELTAHLRKKYNPV